MTQVLDHLLAIDAGDVTGTVRIGDETFRFADGTVSVSAGPAEVHLRADDVTLLRLVTGEANAGLEYLSGRLDIDGDCDLALAVGALFGVDPRDLDPADVARALEQVDGPHLKQVLRSGFRPVVLGEIFDRMPDFVNERKAQGADLTIGFRLLGNPSGDVERYVVRLRNGVLSVGPGEEGERRDATVTCEGHDFLRLVTGHLSAVTGVLRGQLKVKGDKGKALALASAMDIPSA